MTLGLTKPGKVFISILTLSLPKFGKVFQKKNKSKFQPMYSSIINACQIWPSFWQSLAKSSKTSIFQHIWVWKLYLNFDPQSHRELPWGRMKISERKPLLIATPSWKERHLIEKLLISWKCPFLLQKQINRYNLNFWRLC